MTGIRKRFDTALFQLADSPGKEKALSLLKDSEFNVIENPKKREVDLLVYKDGKHVASIEVECKRVWKEMPFKYKSVQFAERKERLVKTSKVPVIFCMFDLNFDNHLTCTGDIFLASPKVEVPNRYVYKGEFFYQVPIDKVVFNALLTVLRKVV